MQGITPRTSVHPLTPGLLRKEVSACAIRLVLADQCDWLVPFTEVQACETESLYHADGNASLQSRSLRPWWLEMGVTSASRTQECRAVLETPACFGRFLIAVA